MERKFGTIIQIGDILVSEDVVADYFACDYEACRGAYRYGQQEPKTLFERAQYVAYCVEQFFIQLHYYGDRRTAHAGDYNGKSYKYAQNSAFQALGGIFVFKVGRSFRAVGAALRLRLLQLAF